MAVRKNGQGGGLLYATAILGAGTVMVKLLGALFKIPLTNLLGGVGMASFNVAYEVYLPLYALFIAGIPAAVSHQVSESMATGRFRDARRLLSISTGLFGVLGCFGFLGMFFGAQWFANFVQNPDGALAIKALSPALLFGSITACYRGYSQGKTDMLPTSLSQMLEALGKLVLGLALAIWVLHYGEKQFALNGTVFGTLHENAEQAHLALVPYGAAAAILGITASCLMGMLFLMVLNRHRGDISPELMRYTCPKSAKRVLARRLLKTAVPICLTASIANLTSFLDLVSVMNRLGAIVDKNEPILRQMYAGCIPEELGSEQLAAYLYGSYSGLASPIFNLVPALTGVLAVSLLPLACRSWAVRDKKTFRLQAQSGVLWSAVISFPAGMGLFFLSEPILHLLYPGRPMEVTVIAPSLSLMGLGAMVVGVTLPVNASLQAMGKAYTPMKLLLFGGLVKLVCNFFLVAQPRFNIHGAPVGTVACYLLVLAGGLIALSDGCENLHLGRILGRPLAASLLCGLGAKYACAFLQGRLSDALVTLFSIAFGAVVYLVALVFLKTIEKEDIKVLFGAEKFEKLLAKIRFIG